jgi:hypothetical protein
MDKQRCHEYFLKNRDKLLASYRRFYRRNRKGCYRKRKNIVDGPGNRERLTAIQRNYLFRRENFQRDQGVVRNMTGPRTSLPIRRVNTIMRDKYCVKKAFENLRRESQSLQERKQNEEYEKTIKLLKLMSCRY